MYLIRTLSHVLLLLTFLFKLTAHSQCDFDSLRFYQEKGNFEKALYIIDKCKNQEDVSASERSNAFYLEGNIYRQKGNYVQAVNSYESGLEIAVKNDLYKLEAGILNSLGGLYVETESFEKGLKYINQSLDIYKSRFPDLKSDICLILTNIGNIHIFLEDYEQALYYLNEADLLNSKVGNEYYGSLIYSGIGLCELKLNNTEKAIFYLQTGLESSRKSGDKQSEIAVLANLGNAYVTQENYVLADSLLSEALSQARFLNDKYLIKEVLSVLISLSEKKQDFTRAYNYQKEYVEIKDTLFQQDLNNKLTSAELNYENIKKEKRILELNVKNQRQGFYLVLGLIALAIVVLLFVLSVQRTKLKNTREIAELQSKMFRLQIKPHFIFNVLSSIQSYMSINEGKKAAVYLSKFARLMRNVLEQSQSEFNTIAHEVSILKHYLDLQQLRFEKGFEYNFSISKEIDPEIILIPPLLLQPLIENAVEHGFNDMIENALLEIDFKLIDGALWVDIKDNGRGMDSREYDQKNDSELIKRESLSMKIISEQLRHYSGQFKEEYQLLATDLRSQGKTGTLIQVKVPFKKQIA